MPKRGQRNITLREDFYLRIEAEAKNQNLSSAALVKTVMGKYLDKLDRQKAAV